MGGALMDTPMSTHMYWRYKFLWDFSRIKFYWCLLVHRKYRLLPDGKLESACDRCYSQRNVLTGEIY